MTTNVANVSGTTGMLCTRPMITNHISDGLPSVSRKLPWLSKVTDRMVQASEAAAASIMNVLARAEQRLDAMIPKTSAKTEITTMIPS